MAGPVEADSDVRVLLAALGGPDFSRLVEPFDRFGEGACDVLLRVVAGEAVEPVGAPGVHGRAVHEDFGVVLSRAARQWPLRFSKLVAGDPRLRDSSTVLWALGSADTATSEQLLGETIRARAPGQQYARWAALASLKRLGSPTLPDLLTWAIKDRSSLVRGSAVFVAIGYGDARLVAPLQRIAAAERAQVGTRRAAWDALEAIRLRENLDAPVGPQRVRELRHPGSRWLQPVGC